MKVSLLSIASDRKAATFRGRLPGLCAGSICACRGFLYHGARRIPFCHWPGETGPTYRSGTPATRTITTGRLASTVNRHDVGHHKDGGRHGVATSRLKSAFLRPCSVRFIPGQVVLLESIQRKAKKIIRYLKRTNSRPCFHRRKHAQLPGNLSRPSSTRTAQFSARHGRKISTEWTIRGR